MYYIYNIFVYIYIYINIYIYVCTIYYTRLKKVFEQSEI